MEDNTQTETSTTTTTTTPAAVTPVNVETTVTEAPPKKYSKRVIEMVGLESCGGCQEATEFIETQVKPNSDVPVEFVKYDVNSDKGKEIVKDKNLKYVPHIRECLIPANPEEQPSCKEINNYDKKFFKLHVNE